MESQFINYLNDSNIRHINFISIYQSNFKKRVYMILVYKCDVDTIWYDVPTSMIDGIIKQVFDLSTWVLRVGNISKKVVTMDLCLEWEGDCTIYAEDYLRWSRAMSWE